MLKYSKIYGLELQGTNGLPSIPISPEGEAIGAIPGWRVFFDPAYPVGTGARNRAKAKGRLAATAGSLVFNTFAGGLPALTTGSTSVADRAATVDVDFPQNEWSIFFTTKASAIEAVVRYVLRPNVTGGLSGYSPIAYFGNTGRLTVGNTNNTVIRVSDPLPLVAGQTTLHMITFSVDDGLRMFRNGVQVAANAADKTPINEGFAAGGYQMFRSAGVASEMQFGMAGILSIDLGKAVWGGARLAIDRFMKAKYGIA